MSWSGGASLATHAMSGFRSPGGAEGSPGFGCVVRESAGAVIEAWDKWGQVQWRVEGSTIMEPRMIVDEDLNFYFDARIDETTRRQHSYSWEGAHRWTRDVQTVDPFIGGEGVVVHAAQGELLLRRGNGRLSDPAAEDGGDGDDEFRLVATIWSSGAGAFVRHVVVPVDHLEPAAINPSNSITTGGSRENSVAASPGIEQVYYVRRRLSSPNEAQLWRVSRGGGEPELIDDLWDDPEVSASAREAMVDGGGNYYAIVSVSGGDANLLSKYGAAGLVWRYDGAVDHFALVGDELMLIAEQNDDGPPIVRMIRRDDASPAESFTPFRLNGSGRGHVAIGADGHVIGFSSSGIVWARPDGRVLRRDARATIVAAAVPPREMF